MKPEEIVEDYFKNIQRAQFLMEVARWNEALRELGLHLAKYPDDYGALCNAAICHLQLNELQSAFDLTKQAIESDPENEWAFRIQSNIFGSNGEYKRALDSAILCIEKAPSMPEAAQCLFWAQINFGALEDAALTLEAVKRSSPDSAETYECIGILALRTEKYEEARAAYLEALRIEPESINSLNNLGVVYMQMAERGMGSAFREKALEMFTRAAKAEPSFKLAQENISVASTPLKYTAPLGLIFGVLMLGRLFTGVTESLKLEVDTATIADTAPILVRILDGYTFIALVLLLLLGVAWLNRKFRQRIVYAFSKSKYWFIIFGVFSIPALYYAFSFWKLGHRATVHSGFFFGASLLIAFLSGINGAVRSQSR